MFENSISSPEKMQKALIWVCLIVGVALANPTSHNQKELLMRGAPAIQRK